MKTIYNPEEHYFSEFGGADVTIFFYHDTKKTLFDFPEWRPIGEDRIITLDMIREQIEDKHGKNLIVVIAEYPLRGNIYRYGSYADKCWVQVGETCGYA